MSLITPNTDALSSYFAKAKYLMAWRISLAFSVAFFILTSVFTKSDPRVFGVFLTILIIILSCIIYLKTTKKFNPLFWVYTVSGTILVHVSNNIIFEFTHYVDFLWMICITLLAFVGLGRKIGFIFIVLHAIGITYFFTFSLNKHIQILEVRSINEIIRDIIEIFFALAIISYLLSQYIVFNSHFANRLKRANIQLSKKNEENIVLVKEIHHRVKNNLQIVISLLRLQKGELKSDEAKRHFNEAINRIMVMSLIHKKLYQETEMAHIEIQPYLKELSNDVIRISNMGFPIRFKINSEVDKIGLKTIVPLGLLINELLSNSIKHAFLKKEDGLININIFKRKKIGYTVIYSDNGNWIEPKKNCTGFGLGLIQTLAEQLEGNMTRNQSEYTFSIKNLDN